MRTPSATAQRGFEASDVCAGAASKARVRTPSATRGAASRFLGRLCRGWSVRAAREDAFGDGAARLRDLRRACARTGRLKHRVRTPTAGEGSARFRGRPDVYVGIDAARAAREDAFGEDLRDRVRTSVAQRLIR